MYDLDSEGEPSNLESPQEILSSLTFKAHEGLLL